MSEVTSSALTLISRHQAILGEGPVWFRDQLLWVDIEGRKVIVSNPVSETEKIIELPERIGCVWPCADSSRLLCGLQSGFALLDPTTGTLRPITDPEKNLPRTRFNDGKCDPLGRFWAGTMDMDEGAPLGSLYMLDADARATRQWQGVTVSNGLAWGPDGTTFYYIDSPTRKIAAFDYEAETGHLTNHRFIITLPEGEGFPDGMTIDTEGKLWIALWQGWGVVRYDPKTGERIGKIDIPVERVTSCTFGGSNLDELFITTARIGVDPADSAGRPQPDAGAVFRIKTQATGLPTVPYRSTASQSG
ncbi:MAG: sugar lactone lactonase YvrE [Verrucomicrobiales bacterium]|jgi:sugar lactone lactonase YvrE